LRYVSTRGGAPVLAFDEVLLAGLAQDGGLYVPEAWPVLDARDWAALAGKPYADVALAVLRPYVGTAIAGDVLRGMLEDCYRGFTHPAVAPLKQLAANDWLLELFHGPTIAFKDYALQLVGRLFDHVLARRGERITIVGATSGDTGSAAIEACRDRAGIDIFILHPHGRVSDVQRRQMTTVTSSNVHNIAIDGTFDDCQDLVKAMFADAPFRDALRLSAVNSINWVRIAAQIVYYATSALALGAPQRSVSYCVPTGNFGNVFAAYAARRMGLPIARLVIASNRNDILTRMMGTGAMTMAPVEASLSPSMDIQVSSNFERLLFELSGRDGKTVATLLGEFRSSGAARLPQGMHGALREIFDAGRADDAATLAMIAATAKTVGETVDPHTAVALHVASRNRGDPGVPMVTLATAHPAKFPDAVERATGIRPELPMRLAGLMNRPERLNVLPNDLTAVETFVRAHARI
jgi:threonine synthase